MDLFLINESGQGMVEYGLIIALVALAAFIGVTVLGGGTGNLYKSTIEKLPF